MMNRAKVSICEEYYPQQIETTSRIEKVEKTVVIDGDSTFSQQSTPR
jgi:hypothetical protein